MKYVIYLAIAVLVIWSVWYVIRHIRRQLAGRCGCEDGCSGNCSGCGKTCHEQKK